MYRRYRRPSSQGSAQGNNGVETAASAGCHEQIFSMKTAEPRALETGEVGKSESCA